MAFKDRMGSAEPEISFSSRRAVESIGSVSGRHDDERYDTAAEASRSSVMVSVFTPCELLQEAGLYPYNVESFSCYLAASQ